MFRIKFGLKISLRDFILKATLLIYLLVTVRGGAI